MSAAVDQESLHSLLCGTCETGDDPHPFAPLTTVCHRTLRHRFTFVFPPPSNLYALLDVAKVCMCCVHEEILEDSGACYGPDTLIFDPKSTHTECINRSVYV